MKGKKTVSFHFFKKRMFYEARVWFCDLQQGWCDSKGTLEDIKSSIQMRREGAFKRERAVAYSLAHKVCYLKNMKAPFFGKYGSKKNGHLFFSVLYCLAVEIKHGEQIPIELVCSWT